MADLFIGIENTNEFFTQHYLAAILADNIKPRLAEWREQAAQRKDGDGPTRTPPQSLGLQHLEFFRTRERLERSKAPEARVQAHLEVFAGILQALGYAPRRSVAALPTGHLPLLATVQRANGAPLL